MLKPQAIHSGGQTGADIGGICGARRAGIKTGGYAPRGYKTEKGPQEQALRDLGLIAHPSPNYRDRTRENVKKTDATLIFATDFESNGTQQTMRFCEEFGKPYLLINPDRSECLAQCRSFLEKAKPKVLNIAGNRESKSPGIASKTARIIQSLFAD